MNPERSATSRSSFLEQFDNYVAARARLKETAEGSDDERLCIANCADQWRLLVDAREGIKE